MTIMMHLPDRGRYRMCTGIIEISGTCRNAGPFFMAEAAVNSAGSGPGLAKKKRGNMVPCENEVSGKRAPDQVSGALRRRRSFSRTRVVTKLWQTAERQVLEIETRMIGMSAADTGGDPQALDRDAKTLATIAKTIRDLVALDVEAMTLEMRSKTKEHGPVNGSKPAKTDPVSSEDAADIDLGPRDIEEFRVELTRRLDELRRERDGGAAS